MNIGKYKIDFLFRKESSFDKDENTTEISFLLIPSLLLRYYKIKYQLYTLHQFTFTIIIFFWNIRFIINLQSCEGKK